MKEMQIKISMSYYFSSGILPILKRSIISKTVGKEIPSYMGVRRVYQDRIWGSFWKYVLKFKMCKLWNLEVLL
jgi:hypothetical protein